MVVPVPAGLNKMTLNEALQKAQTVKRVRHICPGSNYVVVIERSRRGVSKQMKFFGSCDEDESKRESFKM